MTPTLLHSPRDLAEIVVADAMTAGVLACPLETPLREVARRMAERRVHCIVACDTDEPTEAPWGVVSDHDLVAAASAGAIDRRTAGGTAATPVITVTPGETLERAAQLLTEHAVGHLLVVDAEDGRPAGVLSTLDVARALAAREP